MSKKFDVVIGNPPYQEEAQGTATHGKPIYDRFMEAAYEVGNKVVLITPARFLFDAGYTPKAWNAKMLADPCLSIAYYLPNSAQLFPGTDIMGGIVVTYRDASQPGNPIGTFTANTELNTIVPKVERQAEQSLSTIMTSSRSYGYTDEMHADHPEAFALMAKGEQYKVNTKTFEQLHFLYHEQRPNDGGKYVAVLGLIKNVRHTRWIRSSYLKGPESFRTFKVILPASNGSPALGSGAPTPVIGEPVLGTPREAVTQTFITIGAFHEKSEAEACLKYVKTKFARAMLGVLKITQHNPAKVWKYVPLQDFTAESDIDWLKPISEVDQQLYAKYGLDDEEIEFIESHVKSME